MINACWGWRQLAGVAGMAGGAMKALKALKVNYLLTSDQYSVDASSRGKHSPKSSLGWHLALVFVVVSGGQAGSNLTSVPLDLHGFSVAPLGPSLSCGRSYNCLARNPHIGIEPWYSRVPRCRNPGGELLKYRRLRLSTETWLKIFWTWVVKLKKSTVR